MRMWTYSHDNMGDKNNSTLMDGSNKAAKIILDKPLYSSSSEALVNTGINYVFVGIFNNACIFLNA